MRKYPSDVSVSENCIDVNLEMAERGNPDNFPPFPAAEMVRVGITIWAILISNPVSGSKH